MSSYTCPWCNGKWATPDDAGVEVIICPHCGKSLTVAQRSALSAGAPEDTLDTGSGAPYRDLSVGILILSNLVTIGIAIVQRWPVGTIMWIYWCQSVTIGVFMARRMARLRNFSTEGITYSNKRVPETKAGRDHIVKFFIMHYGGFHLCYMMYLSSIAPMNTAEVRWMLVCVATFVVNHMFSSNHNIAEDLKGKPNIGTMMAMPYARIIPMHLCIGMAAVPMGMTAIPEEKDNLLILITFMVLKTVADVIMHIAEHHVYRKGRISGGRQPG